MAIDPRLMLRFRSPGGRADDLIGGDKGDDQEQDEQNGHGRPPGLVFDVGFFVLQDELVDRRSEDPDDQHDGCDS